MTSLHVTPSRISNNLMSIVRLRFRLGAAGFMIPHAPKLMHDRLPLVVHRVAVVVNTPAPSIAAVPTSRPDYPARPLQRGLVRLRRRWTHDASSAVRLSHSTNAVTTANSTNTYEIRV